MIDANLIWPILAPGVMSLRLRVRAVKDPTITVTLAYICAWSSLYWRVWYTLTHLSAMYDLVELEIIGHVRLDPRRARW
jgi:hypothetical protein